MAHQICRTKIKGSGPRKSAQPAREPDFYKMPPLPGHANKKNSRQEGSATTARGMTTDEKKSTSSPATLRSTANLYHPSPLPQLLRNNKSNVAGDLSPVASSPSTGPKIAKQHGALPPLLPSSAALTAGGVEGTLPFPSPPVVPGNVNLLAAALLQVLHYPSPSHHPRR